MAVSPFRRRVGRWAWAVGGAPLALVVWRLFVPWDLSEETAPAAGFYDPAYSSGGGGDQHAPQIALVLVVVTGLALMAIFAGRPGAKWPGTVGAGTWAALFAWRAAVSTTNGANLWPVAFVMLVGPAAIVAGLLVHAAARWRSRSAKADIGGGR